MLNVTIILLLLSNVWSQATLQSKSNVALNITQLMNHILQLEQSLSDIKSKSEAQEQKYAAVLSNVLSKLTATTDELSTLKSDFANFKDNCTTTKGMNSKYQDVAFSVGLARNQQLSPGKTVPYGRIMTNIGNGYNNQTGVFTCPVAGVYVFHFHALSEQNQLMFLDMYKNKEYIATAWGLIPDNYMDGSNTAVLTLHKGDTVAILAGGVASTVLYGAVGQVYATFSGFLLDSTF